LIARFPDSTGMLILAMTRTSPPVELPAARAARRHGVYPQVRSCNHLPIRFPEVTASKKPGRLT
jgi:hypothetical protein